MPTLFRPCIDLHQGVVKQIVGSTLAHDDNKQTIAEKCEGLDSKQLVVNFESKLPARHFASKFKKDDLRNGHVIMLGSGNIDAATEVLNEWPGGFQLGGGMNFENSAEWLSRGAGKLIYTSHLFPKTDVSAANGDIQEDPTSVIDGQICNSTSDIKHMFSEERLRRLNELIGRENIVVDLSCCPLKDETATSNKQTMHTEAPEESDSWIVCINGWRTKTSFQLTETSLQLIGQYCSEILVHAVDKEGTCGGIDTNLISFLSHCSPVKTTYAGGIKSMECIKTIESLSLASPLDFTVGSALDLFGGSLLSYDECVNWNLSRHS